MRHCVRCVAFVVALIAGGALAGPALHPPAPALPALVQQSAGEMRVLGHGAMRWFGLHVYDATLWVRGREWSPGEPFVLEIHYGRDISGEQLAATSVTEMRRLGYRDEALLERWGAAMRRVFPDVARCDRLIGVYRTGSGASFYGRDRFLGAVDDPEFARAFFGIWLDPKTREPGLRARLLGKS